MHPMGLRHAQSKPFALETCLDIFPMLSSPADAYPSFKSLAFPFDRIWAFRISILTPAQHHLSLQPPCPWLCPWLAVSSSSSIAQLAPEHRNRNLTLPTLSALATRSGSTPGPVLICRLGGWLLECMIPSFSSSRQRDIALYVRPR